MSLDRRTKVWRVRVFTATWLSYACFYFSRKPFYVVKSTLEEEFAWDTEMLGTLGMLYLVAYTFGQFAAGWAGNKYGPRLLLAVGMATSALMGLAFGFTNSFAMFGLFMFVNGLAQGTGWSGNVGSMASWFHRQERGTVMGLWATNYQVGGVLATAFAAWILGVLDFRWSFFTGSVVLLLAWVYFLVNQRNKPEDVGLDPITGPAGPEDEDPPTEEVPRDQAAGGWSFDTKLNVAIIGVFYFFVKFIRYAIWSWAPYLLDTRYGLAKDEAGFLSTAFDAAGVVGVIAIGVMSDRIFNGRRAQVSFFFICGLALSCLAMFWLAPTSLVLFGVTMAMVGFTLYGPDSLMTGAGAIDVGSRRDATLAAGIINGMGSAGAVVQELVFGRLLDGKDAAIAPVFATLVASAVLAALCLGVLLMRNRHGKADM